MKQYPWLKRLALALVGGVTLFGIICGFRTLFHLTLNWQEELLGCAAYVVALWVLSGGPFPEYPPASDAPPHPHRLRLHYVGDCDGFRVVCDDCHAAYPLCKSIIRWMMAVMFALALVWDILAKALLHIPEFPNRLLLWVCAAMYIVHGVSWLILRRRDPVMLLSAEHRAARRASASDDN